MSHLIKIIGAGFPRTGTSTLKNALETLGYGKCYHMKELLVHPDKLKFWKEIDSKGHTDWESLFNGYQSCVDVPGYPYYKVLMDQYPEAKVILTVRPFDQWYESASKTVRKAGPQNLGEKLNMLLRLPFDSRLRQVVAAIKFFEHIFWTKQFEGGFDDPAHAKRVFDNHIEEVKTYVPSDRLLVYNVAEGWGPLCDFLGHPRSSETFPHLNKKENFHEMLEELMKGNMV